MANPSALERFWSRVKKSTGCWEWTGSKCTQGYGVMWHEGRQRMTHRISFKLFVGEIPEGRFICHHCDNPACVRPSHLFAGSHRDNMADAARKGRWLRRLNQDEAQRATELLRAGMAITKVQRALGVGDTEIIRRHTGSIPRNHRGPLSNRCKLTEAQVAFIKAQPYRRGIQTELGKRFGVHGSTVNRIMKAALTTPPA